MRLIDADVLKGKITDIDGGCAIDGTGFDIYTCEVFELIDEVPTAEDVVERKKGEWIKIDKYDKESNVQCSVCLEEFDYIDGVCYLCHGYELPLFCPNCGADMR